VRYVGGKGRIAAAIADRIRDLSPAAPIAYEPFMGGGSVTAELAPRFPLVIASDAHPDLVLMWRAVLEGWAPPEVVTEAEYAALKIAEPSPLRGFVGFGGSFGGKWFAGYARGGVNKSGPRNHQAESARAVMRIGAQLRRYDVFVARATYGEIPIEPGSVVYCDPPYLSTLGYKSAGGFDPVDFWAWAEVTSDVADVYVSEYVAPPGWACVWSAQKRQSVTRPDQGRELRTERLFRLAR
jgi:DNA adenine methylase